ncbi:MAG TPA: Fe-S cluster assembly protein SufD [Xanthobacteraceae bacterium]|nr:Fe-S cluster assembly protein SufD [Xanthobacteraceae bacterium]
MNAEIRPIRTPAEQALAASIEAVQGKLPGASEVKKLRETAGKAFVQSGLPHRRVEEWKYTDLRALMRDAAPLASPPDKHAIEQAKKHDPFPGVEARRLVLVNGAFVSELSDLANVEEGLTIAPLAKALAAGNRLVQRIGELRPDTYDAALSLNTALLNDGVLIEIAVGAKLARPIHIVHFHSGSAPSSTYARSLIVAGTDSQATVIESFAGPEAVAYQTNSAMELHVGDTASFDFIRLQAEGGAALHLSTLLAKVGSDAKFAIHPVAQGAAVSRFSVTLRFAGKNIDARFAGATMLRGRQHADTTLVIDHMMPYGNSRELMKSALDDESRGVFQGRINVHHGAQKTDAKMATHALMLSDTAESDNKPELEIFADDVQCGHGATSGAIDEELLFYFLARGIPRKEAEALLIQSFVAEPIEMIAHEGLREALLARAADWLKARA